ncbi:hypothetical protein BMB171_C2010 [Bacillus thuringiensis BMB171]|nr:hypothetical protein BMB171_C2010 [Bacillus thuringiensis BMB171]
MIGNARGSSTFHNLLQLFIPIAFAASIRDSSNSLIPVYVFRKIGNSAYTTNAIIAGSFPIPTNGINSPSNASDGTVCITAEVPIINSAIRSFLVNKMPSGTAIITAKNNEISDICKCSLNAVSNSIFRSWNVCIKLVTV